MQANKRWLEEEDQDDQVGKHCQTEQVEDIRVPTTKFILVPSPSHQKTSNVFETFWWAVEAAQCVLS